MAKSYTYNAWANMTWWYLYDTVNGFSLRSNAGGDLLNDDITVGDAVYFTGFQRNTFNKIRVTVGTALAADAITFVWEYYDGGVWQAVANLVDGTNDFTNLGQNEVSWDLPLDMSDAGGAPAPYLFYVRARVTAVTNPTEGGSLSSRPDTGDNLVTADGGTIGDPIIFSDLYTEITTNIDASYAEVNSANAWRKRYLFYVGLKIVSGCYFTDSNVEIEIRGHSWYGDGILDISDCVITCSITSMPHYWGGNNGSGDYTRCSLVLGGSVNAAADMYFYGAAAKMVYTDCIFKAFATTIGYIKNTTWSNVTISGLSLIKPNIGVSMLDTDFGNCYFSGDTRDATFDTCTLSSSNIGVQTTYILNLIDSTYPYSNNINGAWLGRIFHRRRFDLHVVDSDGVAINGATVQITDSDGARAEVHAILTADAASGQKIVTLDDTSLLSGGDSIDIGMYAGRKETMTIDTVDSATQITLTANLANTHYVDEMVHDNTSQDLTADASGDIAQQQLVEKVVDITGAGNSFDTDAKTPHTVTISATGYLTRTIPYATDRKREEIEMLARKRPLFDTESKVYLPISSSGNVITRIA